MKLDRFYFLIASTHKYNDQKLKNEDAHANIVNKFVLEDNDKYVVLNKTLSKREFENIIELPKKSVTLLKSPEHTISEYSSLNVLALVKDENGKITVTSILGDEKFNMDTDDILAKYPKGYKYKTEPEILEEAFKDPNSVVNSNGFLVYLDKKNNGVLYIGNTTNTDGKRVGTPLFNPIVSGIKEVRQVIGYSERNLAISEHESGNYVISFSDSTDNSYLLLFDKYITPINTNNKNSRVNKHNRLLNLPENIYIPKMRNGIMPVFAKKDTNELVLPLPDESEKVFLNVIKDFKIDDIKLADILTNSVYTSLENRYTRAKNYTKFFVLDKNDNLHLYNWDYENFKLEKKLQLKNIKSIFYSEVYEQVFDNNIASLFVVHKDGTFGVVDRDLNYSNELEPLRKDNYDFTNVFLDGVYFSIDSLLSDTEFVIDDIVKSEKNLKNLLTFKCRGS